MLPDPLLSRSIDPVPLCLEACVSVPCCAPGKCMTSLPSSELSLKGFSSIRETQMKTQGAPTPRSPSLGISEQVKEEMTISSGFVGGRQQNIRAQEKHFSDLEKVGKVFQGQEHTAGKGWVLTLLFAFSFLQELQRNPHLITDGVSRFDIMQGEIGKVIFSIWRRSAQSSNL